MDINGGSITFKAGLDNSQLNKAVKATEQQLGQMASGAEAAGAAIDNAMKQSAEQLRRTLEAINANMQSNEEELAALRNQYAMLGREAGEAFMQGDDEGYRQRTRQQEAIKRNIALLNQEQQELKGERDSMEKNLATLDRQIKSQEKSSDKQQQLIRQIRELRNQMAALAAAGQKGGEEYAALADKAGALQDAYADTTKAIRGMASDTANLDAVLSLASAGTGGFSALTGAMQIFGAESEDVEKAQAKLQAAIALATGVQQIQMAVQKESAVMLGIQRIQTTALAKSQALATKNTIAATVAQKAFNLVAKANPYVLLAMALATVVGALAAFALGNKDAAKSQQQLNEVEAIHISQLERINEAQNRTSNERVRNLENELKAAKARNASYKELEQLEDKILAEKTAQNARSRGFYAQEILDLETNRKKLEEFNQELERLQALKAMGEKKVMVDLKLNGKMEKVAIADAIDLLQQRVDNYGKKVDVAVSLKQEQSDLETEQKVQAAERKQRARDAAKTELDIVRATQDARLSLIRDAYTKETAIRKAQTERAIEDIRLRLSREANLTTKARKALNEQTALLQQQLDRDLEQMAQEHQNKLRLLQRESQDEQMSLMKEGAAKQRATLRQEYTQQFEDINIELKDPNLSTEEIDRLNERIIYLRQRYAQEATKLEAEIRINELEAEKEALSLRLEVARKNSAEELAIRQQMIEKERQLALEQNRLLAEDVRQSEADINARYDAERATLLVQASKEYKAFFADISGMTKKQTQDAISRLKSIVEYVNGTTTEAPLGISSELLEQLKQSPEALQEVYQRILELQKQYNKESGYPFASIVSGIKKIQEADRRYGVETRRQRKAMRETNQEYNNALLDGENAILQSGTEVAAMFGNIGSRLEDLGKSINDAHLQSLGQQLSSISSLASAVASGAAAGGWIGVLIAGGLEIITQLADAYASAQVQEYEAEVRTIKFTDALRLLDLQLKSNYDNAFGERTFTRIADAAETARQALAAYSEAIGQLNDKFTFDEDNPYIVDPDALDKIANAYDAVQRGLSNLGATQILTRDRSGLANFFGFSDEYSSLADLAPDLFNADGSVKEDAIQSLLDSYGAYLDEKTKQLLQNALDLKKAYDDAAKSVRDFIGDTFGYLGDEAVNALVNAIESGSNAWETFRKSGAKAIESLGEQLVYELFLASHFQDFQDQLERIYGIGEYANEAEREYYGGLSSEEKADEVMRAQDQFFDQMQAAMAAGESFMEAYKDHANRYGWDLWDDESTTSLTGSVKNITEESASLIAGHMNAIRLMTSEANTMLQRQLYYLADIETNTAYLRTIDTRLRNIESNMSSGNYARRLGYASSHN